VSQRLLSQRRDTTARYVVLTGSGPAAILGARWQRAELVGERLVAIEPDTPCERRT
jgi:hypothetical protein